jgi:2-methylisocitrate lyase-like PEP mutase family enzyme
LNGHATATASTPQVPLPSRMRHLLAAPAILEQPAICDPLGARSAAEAGYHALTLPGYAIAAHLPGDVLVSLDDIERAVRRVTEACRVPVMLDADTGWDIDAELPSAVARLTAAGAAAIQLGSNHMPAAVPFHDQTERRNADANLLFRVRAAVATGADVLITARCDIEASAYSAALDRAHALLAAGAAALVVHSDNDIHLRCFAADLPGAWLIYSANPALPSRPSVFSVAKLQSWGYSAVSNKYHQCYCARTALGRTGASKAQHASRQG